MVQSNDVTERFATRVFIISWVIVFCVWHVVCASIKTAAMQDQLEAQEQTIAGYKEELAEYQSLLDTEIDKNAELTDTIDALKSQLSDIEDELHILEQEKNTFEEAHKDCRPPIGYSQDNVLTPSNITAEELSSGLLYDLKRYAGCFVEMEKEYGVNAIFLASVAALESGWCRTDIAVNNNNLFGYKNPSGNGFRYFSSKEDSIVTVAKHLKTNYLTEGAPYYNGLSIKGINVKYCEQKDWYKKIDMIAAGIIDRITNT